ncbi:MAG: nitroreductase family protein [Nitrososphaeraceae archaeon]
MFLSNIRIRALTAIKTLSIAMDFDEVVKRRKMIREYDSVRQQIPDELITKLIKNAHKAPSAGHTQVQEFIIVKDASTKKKLRKAAVNQEYVEKAPLLIVVCSNTSRSVGRYGNRGREFYSIIDSAFASMLILLSVVNEGIGACLVGAFQDNKVSEILELPKDVRPIGIICIGYPAEKPEKLERIDVKALVHYEKYGRKS